MTLLPGSAGRPQQEEAFAWDGLTVAPLSTVDDGTLLRFHTMLLEPAFPPAELMTYEEIRDARREAGTRGIILLDGAEPVAGIVTEDYVGGRVLLVVYLVVAPSVRNRGIGARLLSKAGAQRTPAPLMLAEIEDPRYFPASDAGDPAARVRFYDRAGSRLLPLPYVQPSLRPGSPRVDGLLLIAIRPPGADVDGSLIAAFLDEYYALCEGDEVTRMDLAYRALRVAARGDEYGRLSLLPLSALEAARPAPVAEQNRQGRPNGESK